eukprot:scaffold118899_cov63-Phaeocystis_antarctica.AAC.5
MSAPARATAYGFTLGLRLELLQLTGHALSTRTALQPPLRTHSAKQRKPTVRGAAGRVWVEGGIFVNTSSRLAEAPLAPRRVLEGELGDHAARTRLGILVL